MTERIAYIKLANDGVSRVFAAGELWYVAADRAAGTNSLQWRLAQETAQAEILQSGGGKFFL